jgi:CRP-like cAMP-binding protein
MPEYSNNQKDILLQNIKDFVPLSNKEEQIILSVLQFKKIRKREFILREGDISDVETFVVRGCMRSYFIDKEGIEHVIMFATENQWIVNALSFTEGVKSDVFIDALEDSELFQIEKPSIEKLYNEIPSFEKFFRIRFQKAFINEQQRVICNFTKAAQDRYLNFLALYPNLEQRIPQHQIASFLGITPQFLSQVRTLALKEK